MPRGDGAVWLSWPETAEHSHQSTLLHLDAILTKRPLPAQVRHQEDPALPTRRPLSLPQKDSSPISWYLLVKLLSELCRRIRPGLNMC